MKAKKEILYVRVPKQQKKYAEREAKKEEISLGKWVEKVLKSHEERVS